jgi:hypothetical protein
VKGLLTIKFSKTRVNSDLPAAAIKISFLIRLWSAEVFRLFMLHNFDSLLHTILFWSSSCP